MRGFYTFKKPHIFCSSLRSRVSTPALGPSRLGNRWVILGVKSLGTQGNASLAQASLPPPSTSLCGATLSPPPARRSLSGGGPSSSDGGREAMQSCTGPRQAHSGHAVHMHMPCIVHVHVHALCLQRVGQSGVRCACLQRVTPDAVHQHHGSGGTQ